MQINLFSERNTEEYNSRTKNKTDDIYKWGNTTITFG